MDLQMRFGIHHLDTLHGDTDGSIARGVELCR